MSENKIEGPSQEYVVYQIARNDSPERRFVVVSGFNYIAVEDAIGESESVDTTATLSGVLGGSVVIPAHDSMLAALKALRLDFEALYAEAMSAEQNRVRMSEIASQSGFRTTVVEAIDLAEGRATEQTK